MCWLGVSVASAVADVACITDGVVALRCLAVLNGCLLCVVVGDGGCVTDGLVGL